MRQLFTLLVVAGLLWAVPAGASVQGRAVVCCAADGTVLEGYLTHDPSFAGQRPGVRTVRGW